MKSFIIVKDFQQSLATHGLIYKFIIANGNVFKTITDLKPYCQHSIVAEIIRV